MGVELFRKLKEEQMLRTFDNMMPRKIFGHKRGVDRGLVLIAP
jgi:hypothetical protein